MLPGFSCRDLVAVLVKYMEGGEERRLVVCSAYLTYDSEDPPTKNELEELVRHCEREKLSGSGVRLERAPYGEGQHQL
jgi:hypothetical protein